ncbi:MAG: hypothetical protein RR461_02355 [Angelakisella sp.]
MKKSSEERLREQIVRALRSIAFTTSPDYGGMEVKLKDSIKALELLCKLHGFLGADKKESDTGQLDELIEGLRGTAVAEEEEDVEEDV